MIDDGSFESSKKRHALYKSRMAELAQYRKQLRKEKRKNEKGMAAEEMAKSQSSKHIDKYRHKQSHKTEDSTKEGAAAAKNTKAKGETDIKDDISDMHPEMQK